MEERGVVGISGHSAVSGREEKRDVSLFFMISLWEAGVNADGVLSLAKNRTVVRLRQVSADFLHVVILGCELEDFALLRARDRCRVVCCVSCFGMPACAAWKHKDFELCETG